MVLNDFMRGKIPWFTAPPKIESTEGKVKEGREGRLGEMPLKRKREEGDTDTVGDASFADDSVVVSDDEESEDGEGEEFSGFETEGETEGGAKLDAEEGEEAEDRISLGGSDDEEDEDEAEQEAGDEKAEESADEDVEKEPSLPPKKRRSARVAGAISRQ
jgi:nuclear GTP-binding protein